MGLLSSVKSAVGFEQLPEGIADKSFYDLKAVLPGKDRELAFVGSAEAVVAAQSSSDDVLLLPGH